MEGIFKGCVLEARRESQDCGSVDEDLRIILVLLWRKTKRLGGIYLSIYLSIFGGRGWSGMNKECKESRMTEVSSFQAGGNFNYPCDHIWASLRLRLKNRLNLPRIGDIKGFEMSVFYWFIETTHSATEKWTVLVVTNFPFSPKGVDK